MSFSNSYLGEADKYGLELAWVLCKTLKSLWVIRHVKR